VRILQVHNRHEEEGGADAVLHAEREQLESAGHVVAQLVYGPASKTGLNRAQMSLAAVWNVSGQRVVSDEVERFRPDVVHVHTPFPLLSPAVFRATGDVPVVTTAHSFRYSCIAGTCRRDQRICEDCVGSRTKLAGVRHRCYHDSLAGSAALTLGLTGHRVLGTFDRVARFVTLTAFAGALLARDGISPSRIVVKPNAVDDPGGVVPVAGRDGSVLFVGRLVEEKGLQTLLTAWQGSGVSLRIAGDGPLRPLVDEAARANPAIEVLGWCDSERLRTLQARAALTVVPSEWYEAGPPLVLLQALAAGTPVVCSDLENISSSVRDAGAGWTFRTGDADSLRAAVDEALAEWPSRPWLDRSAAARALYERDHTPGASLAALETLYDAVVAEPSNGSAHRPTSARR
jgi:glycosyltransferase involved in cell wall biosynthesis